jgi:hypothetical protein
MREIGVDAFTQIFGLADIDYLSGFILKEINTRFLWKSSNAFTRQHPAPSSKKTVSASFGLAPVLARAHAASRGSSSWVGIQSPVTVPTAGANQEWETALLFRQSVYTIIM